MRVLAIRYGTMPTTRQHVFYRYHDYHLPDGPMDLAYYFWAITGPAETVLVDSGFDPARVADRPGRTCLFDPFNGLELVGIDPASVTAVVVTHMHYDHVGNLRRFPDARIVIQRRELDFWTGPFGAHPTCASITNPEEVAYVREAAAAGRVMVVDGDAVVTDQVRVELVGGHCPGQQIVHVDADRPIVIASDALHFYEEMTGDRPYETFTDLPAMLAAYERLRSLDAGGAAIVAGHDPSVMDRFPRVPAWEHAVRIDGSGGNE